MFELLTLGIIGVALLTLFEKDTATTQRYKSLQQVSSARVVFVELFFFQQNVTCKTTRSYAFDLVTIEVFISVQLMMFVCVADAAAEDVDVELFSEPVDIEVVVGETAVLECAAARTFKVIWRRLGRYS